MPLTRGLCGDLEGGISALPSTGWINIILATHTLIDTIHTHTHKPRQTARQPWAYPAGQLWVLICWCVYRVLTNTLFTSPGWANSSLSLSSSDCISGLNLPHLSAVLLHVLQRPLPPPPPYERSCSSFSSRSPATASSCGPRRARSLALTWQVPGLRTTARTNTPPTWGTRRRRWVLWAAYVRVCGWRGVGGCTG